MKVKSTITDHRIESDNVLVETTIGEYLDLIKDSINNNPYQRRRVTSSKTIYSLLKEDIKKGCVLPPIVLAVSIDLKKMEAGETQEEVEDIILSEITGQKDEIIILDGLQRTHSLRDLYSETDSNDIKRLSDIPLRIEFYIGLNKIGILYRMLTLNTGQTPMSLRHQIEMLYQGFYEKGISGVTFIKESEKSKATKENEFNFKEIISGFNSYLERNEQPLDRSDILENIKSLEKLSHENNQHDLFEEYVSGLSGFISKSKEVFGGISLSNDDLTGKQIWGKDIVKCFKREQVYAGFGAGLGKLKDHGIISDLGQIKDICRDLEIGTSPSDFILSLNETLDWISKNTKKIGNAQRLFFQFFFRDIFNSEGETYLQMQKSLDSAKHKINIQLF